jgi:hypothetical protein
VTRIYHTDASGRAWLSPPPAYDPLVGTRARAAGVRTNLMDAFVHMRLPPPTATFSVSASDDAQPPDVVGAGLRDLRDLREREGEGGGSGSGGPAGFGDVMDLDGFVRWCAQAGGAGMR